MRSECIANQYGCGCNDKCRADIHIPPPRRSMIDDFILKLSVGVLVFCGILGCAWVQEQVEIRNATINQEMLAEVAR